MSDEDRLIDLLRQLRELTGAQQRAEVTKELLALLDKHLRRVLAGWRNQLARDGVRYTEMVNDFFVKLLRGGVTDFWDVETEEDLRKLVATVILNQVRDYFRGRKRGQQVLSEITPFVEQRQHYYEERYETTYEYFITQQLVQWRESGDAALVLRAEVLEDHYVGGVKWGNIARQRGLSEEALLKIRRAAMEQLRKKLGCET